MSTKVSQTKTTTKNILLSIRKNNKVKIFFSLARGTERPEIHGVKYHKMCILNDMFQSHTLCFTLMNDELCSDLNLCATHLNHYTF
ncbi:unnamed protein product [Trifolium pratense]|uniref:Uncharacterized protein n=1 Tax=Trifolium pratense TaxID=57577 RepID=A0ACB0KQA0_TRIPR|nr:unnamed protein product [Trifolium pratense]